MDKMKRQELRIRRIAIEFKKELSKIYGDRLKKLVLYGSYARNDADVDSDIDLLMVLDGDVELGKEIKRTSNINFEVNLKYGVILSALPVSLRDYIHNNSPLMLNIRKDGIAV